MVTVSAWSLKSWPATPSTNTSGTKTATVVSVEAKTAAPTSCVPSTAARNSPRPSCRFRKIDSSTTIELSTSMPMPSVRPPRDMTFSEMPSRYISRKVATMEIGIETPMMSVLRQSRRKANSTSTASRPPSSAESRTSLRAWRMNSDWSNRTSILWPAGSLPSHWPSRSFSRRDTVTELASPSL